MRAFAFAALVLALQCGQLDGNLLLDSALFVQLVGGADQVDGHLGFGGQGGATLPALRHVRPLGVISSR